MNKGMYFLAGVGLIFGLLSFGVIPIASILAIILIIGAIVLFFTKKNFYVEYEYTFVNGELSIDKILEMRRRKEITCFNIKSVELIAPEDSYYVKDFSNKPEKVLDLYPDTCDKPVYVAMVTGGLDRMIVRFVPDEKMLELCYRDNPRAIKKN
jgi:hypothetical protein